MAKTARTVLELVTNIDEYLSDLKKGEKGNDEFDKSVQKISKGFQSVGKDISSFGEGMSKYVTLPIVGTVAAAGALISSMADTGDAIAKNAREAGLSAEAYQELKFAVGQVGKLTEEQVDGAFRKLTLTIGDAAAGSDKAQVALQQLGYTQKEIESGSITTEDAFNRLNKTMQGTTSQAEAAALAGELVGDKIGPSLASALRTSGEEVEALRGQFKELGLGMSQEALDASEKFKDELDVLERQLGSLGREIASELMPIIMDDLIPFIRNEVVPRLRDFAQWLGGLAQGFADLSPGMKLFISGSVAMVAAVGPVLVIVGKLVTAFGVALPAAIGATNGALAFFAANPVALAALGIAAAFTAVKVAADNSTAAIRRHIQATTDHNTIQELFNSKTQLTEKQQRTLADALERTEKQTYINSQGLGSLAHVNTGLKLSLEGVSGALADVEAGIKPTKAEIERLRKAKEDAAKATQKLDDELKQLSDRMTGKALQKDMEQLALVVGKWSAEELKCAVQNSDLLKQIDEYRAKGLTLPPVLREIWFQHERLNPSVRASANAYEMLAGILEDLPSIKLPAPPKSKWLELPKGAGWESAGAFMDEMSERVKQNAPVAGADLGSRLVGAFGRAIEGLGDVILGAIMGGGDVGKAAGASIGLSLGNELGEKLTESIGGSLGKLIGGFAGPLGSLLGSALGGVVDKIFGGNDTKKGRERLAGTLGFPSLAALNDALRDMGDEGAALVNEGLNKIGKTDMAAEAEWERKVKALVDSHADLFAIIEKGGDDAAEATAKLNTKAAALGAEAEKTGGYWSTALHELIANAKSAGIELDAVNQLVAGQQSKLASGANGATAAFGKQADEYAAAHKRMLEIDKERAGLIGRELGVEDQKRADALDKEWDALNKIRSATISTQDEFDRLSRIELAAFNTLVASGVDTVTAMGQVGSGIDNLIAGAKAFGFEGNAAFAELSRWRELTTANAPLLAQIGSLNDIMVATANLGGLTATSFADLQAQGVSAYGQLTAAGFTQNEALMAMKPLLESVIQQHKDSGLAIDEETQKLIDQATENGILKAEQISTNDIMLQGLGAIIEALGGQLPDAFKTMAKSAKGAAADVKKEITGAVGGAIDDASKKLQDKEIWEKFNANAKDASSGIRKLFSDPIPVTFEFETAGAPNFAGGPGNRQLAVPGTEFGGYMAEGWYGRVYRPTTFIAGERPGGEDVAFSGVGRSFRSNTERPIVLNATVISKMNQREVGRGVVQVFAESARRAGG